MSTERFASIWQLIATTGMRRAEVCGLRWRDVDLDRGRLRVAQTITEVRGRPIEQEDGKSDAAARVFALDRRTVDVLHLWRARQAEDELAAEPDAWTDSGLVFTDLSGRGYLPRRVSAAFTKAVDAAGLPRIGVHGLRHTYATAALRAGVSPEVVSKRLGHSSVLITLSIYACLRAGR